VNDISRGQFVAAITLCAALALALRIGMTAKFQGISSPPSHDIGLDQIDYEMFAYHLSIGDGYVLEPGLATARRTPGTSLGILPIYWIAGRNFLLARIWWCAISAATVVVVGLLGATIFSRTTGSIAAAFTAFYPGHFYYAMHFSSEVVFGLWLALGLLLFILCIRTTNIWISLAAGICWGLAILTRSQIALLFPLLMLGSLCWAELRRHWRVQLVMTFAALLTVSPWIARNYLVFGKPTMALLLSPYTFWGAHNDVVLNDPSLQGRWIGMNRLVDDAHPLVGTEVERDAAARRYSREWLNQHWADMPWLTVMKLWRLITPFEATGNRAIYWAFAVSWIITGPFVLWGLVQSVRARPLEAIILIMPLLASLVTTILYFGSIRFRDAVSPVFLLFAAVPIAALAEAWVSRNVRRPAPSQLSPLAPSH